MAPRQVRPPWPDISRPPLAMAEAPRIAPIAPSAVRRIAGAQVVPDMRAAVKELIENALDAGATSIGTCAALDAELRFKEYGLGGIEVVDNGSGIRKEDYSMIGRSCCSHRPAPPYIQIDEF